MTTVRLGPTGRVNSSVSQSTWLLLCLQFDTDKAFDQVCRVHCCSVFPIFFQQWAFKTYVFLCFDWVIHSLSSYCICNLCYVVSPVSGCISLCARWRNCIVFSSVYNLL